MAAIKDYARVETLSAAMDGESGGLRTVFCDATRVFPRRSGLYREHAWDEYEMIVPMERPYNCLLDGTKVRVAPGKFLLIPPHQQHQDILAADAPFYAFHFFLLAAEGTDAAAGTVRFFAPGLPPQRQVAALPSPENFKRLCAVLWSSAKKKMHPPAATQALFRALFLPCAAAFPENVLAGVFADYSQSHRAASTVLRAFAANVHRNPQLPELCAAAKMSRSTLNRHCHLLFGLAPLHALAKYKVTCAARVLRDHPQMRIKEISNDFGFTNPFHFSRVFKKYLLRAPSAWSDGD